jgi:hypothetical protein
MKQVASFLSRFGSRSSNDEDVDDESWIVDLLFVFSFGISLTARQFSDTLRQRAVEDVPDLRQNVIYRYTL